jgi:hypothetical protein
VCKSPITVPLPFFLTEGVVKYVLQIANRVSVVFHRTGSTCVEVKVLGVR